jgi:UDP-N-acetylglucosamine 4,6-dehydratase
LPFHFWLVDMTNSILVTGGTGTFGQAFVRSVLQNTDIQRICVYSRGEHAQASFREAIGDDSRVRWMVGDVRDLARLTRACRGIDVVFHAAALKRIETGAYNPDEMVKTNVLGVMNIIEAATIAGVKKVVGLSSDKAYQPISPYGQSKALGESLLLAANGMHGKRGPMFAAARYGNIWNAQGSVVPKWKEAMAQGRVITLTDKDCTRFFMTIEQAVNLVWELSLRMKGGELEIPEWLPAYRLGDLLQAMAPGGFFKTIGLPEFEKKHESMCRGVCSDLARRMTIEELKEHLKDA